MDHEPTWVPNGEDDKVFNIDNIKKICFYFGFDFDFDCGRGFPQVVFRKLRLFTPFSSDSEQLIW